MVTGGASGLGRVLVLRLARLGCTVTVWDVDVVAMASLCRLLPVLFFFLVIHLVFRRWSIGYHVVGEMGVFSYCK